MGSENVMIHGTTGAARAYAAAPMCRATRFVAIAPVFQLRLKLPRPRSETKTQRHRFGMSRRLATKAATPSDAARQRMLVSSQAYCRGGFPAN